MRENRLSGLMRGGKVDGHWLCLSIRRFPPTLHPFHAMQVKTSPSAEYADRADAPDASGEAGPADQEMRWKALPGGIG